MSTPAQCWSTASTCAEQSAGRPALAARPGYPAAHTVLRHHRGATCASAARRRRRQNWQGGRDRPGKRLHCGKGRRHGRRHLAGRHQHLRRPETAAGHRPGPWPSGRASTSSTTASPRWTSRPTPGCAPHCARRPRMPPSSSSPSASAPYAMPTRSSCWTKAAS
jgi:hypothetical protein